MDNQSDPVYSHNVIEFVAVANEYCKYAEHASELKGEEILKIMQRILPLMYLKATLLPSLEPFFEDGNEKFVTEADWNRIHDSLKQKLGVANDFTEELSERFDDSEIPVPVTVAENMADIYQDARDFLLLYQTGTNEVMNDALWECRMNFENLWGKKLLNTLWAIHRFIYSGEEMGDAENKMKEDNERKTDAWFISRRQKDFRGE
jgi:hypothetical protein